MAECDGCWTQSLRWSCDGRWRMASVENRGERERERERETGSEGERGREREREGEREGERGRERERERGSMGNVVYT